MATSIKAFFATPSINDSQHINIECHYAEVDTLSLIMLSVIMLNVVVLTVMAPLVMFCNILKLRFTLSVIKVHLQLAIFDMTFNNICCKEL
jgi:hypothetical protein